MAITKNDRASFTAASRPKPLEAPVTIAIWFYSS
ncbi:hypothetical protein ABIA50_001009 [Bacillus subtilis]